MLRKKRICLFVNLFYVLTYGTKQVQKEQLDASNKDETRRLSDEEKQSIYLAIRTDSVEKLRALVDGDAKRRQKIVDYITFTRFPPDRSTFLHIAAQRDARNVINVSCFSLKSWGLYVSSFFSTTFSYF